MSNRLATIGMGWKLGAVPFFRGQLAPHLTQCRLHRGILPYQVASWSIQPFGYNRHGPKIGGCASLGRGAKSHLTQCGQGRGQPQCQVSSWSIEPFGHNTTIFSERELTFTFAICYRPSVCLSSVVCLSVCMSVTFVRPTQAVQIIGNISMALGTLATHWHPLKISRRSS